MSNYINYYTIKYLNNYFYYLLIDLLVCNSIKLFSNKLTIGTIIKKCENYKTVLICPNSMKGDSTCFAPNCIKIKKLAINK